MNPMTMQECEVGITNVRLQEPDFDALIEEAIDPKTQEVVARLYLQFRDPFHSFRQEGYAATHQKPGKTQKGQYNFAIGPDDPARILHEFNTRYADMRLEATLVCTDGHEKRRDEELRLRA